MSLNVKPSVHSHGDWEVPYYALLFRLVRVRLCLRVLPLCRALQSLDIGRVGSGKNIFFPNFSPPPPAAFSIDGRISSRDEGSDLIEFFSFSFLLLFERIFDTFLGGRRILGIFHLQFCRSLILETCGRRSCMRLIGISSFSIGFLLDVKIIIRRCLRTE